LVRNAVYENTNDAVGCHKPVVMTAILKPKTVKCGLKTPPGFSLDWKTLAAGHEVQAADRISFLCWQTG
jgi:hypothetical protein